MKTWRQFDRKRNKHIRFSKRVFNREFTKIRKYFRSQVVNLGSAELALESLSSETIKRQVKKAYEKTYVSSGVDFAKDTFMDVKKQNKSLSLKNVNDLELIWTQEFIRFVEDECAVKIQSVTRSLIENIEKFTKQVVREGIEEGWGPAKVAKEIYNRTGTDQLWRVIRIARTEVNAGANLGSFKGAGANQSEGMKLNKIWLVNMDSETRDDHIEMANAPAIPLEEKWQVGDDMMKHPHDPNASVENVVNCRCAITYEPANSEIDRLLNN